MTTYCRQTYLRMSPLFHSTHSEQSNFHGGEKAYMFCAMSSGRQDVKYSEYAREGATS